MRPSKTTIVGFLVLALGLKLLANLYKAPTTRLGVQIFFENPPGKLHAALPPEALEQNRRLGFRTWSCEDPNGRCTWERTYGGKLWDRPTAVASIPGGGIFLLGSTTSRGSGYEDFWLLRLDARGRF